MVRKGRSFWLKMAQGWCRLMHNSPMWPINGRYQCRRCFQYHPIAWDMQDRNVKFTPTLLTEDTPMFV